MAYTVLARKYRSRTFDEVIGQGPIATTLANAIRTGRIHHGYLFTGTRGSGKTSMARILAKSLNCLGADGPTVKPCLTCDACRGIAEGQDLDVVEIDAASNTGVDNIRELRSNTAFRPARCRFKIYIIDEVHMLSTGAFNALLKTLEEPPEHVKFILATTEIQKVPATIRSRCQTFTFRNISPDDIAKRLESIAKAEGAEAEDVVLRRVAKLANGSMRDALSIFDQLLSVSPTQLTAAVLDEILPPSQDEPVFRVLAHAASGDVPAVLAGVDAILTSGRGLETFCNDAIEIAHTLLILRACGADTTLVDFPSGNRGEYVKLSGQFELSQYVQMIAMLEELKRNVRFSGAGRALADALFIRLAKLREWASIEQLLAGVSGEASAEKKKSQSTGSVVTPGVAPSAESRLTTRAEPPLREARSLERAFVDPRRSADEPAMMADGHAQAPSTAAVAPAAAAVRGSTSPRGGDRYTGAPAAPDGEERPETDYGAIEDGAAAAARRLTARDADLVRTTVSRDERRRIESHPVVRQAIELFEGQIVNIERVAVPRLEAVEADDA